MNHPQRLSEVTEQLRKGSALPPGILAVRRYKLLAYGLSNPMVDASEFMQRQKWGIEREYIKANISATDTSDISGASMVEHDFQAALHHASILGQLQGLRRVPPRIPLLSQTAPSVAGFAQDGQSRKMSAGTFVRENLPLKSVGGIAVLSNELLASDTFDSELEIHRDLFAACSQSIDQAFIDPDNPGSDSTPASVTSGATPLMLGGTAIADLDVAISTAVQQLVAAGSNLANAAWVMSPTTATALSLARGTSGDLAYPFMGANGGELIRLPAIVSASVQPDSDGGLISLLDASSITYTEDLPNLSVSRNASIEMSNTPTGDGSVPTSGTTLVSMFTAELTALLASIPCNWKLRHTGCVQVIGGVPSTITAA